MKLRKPIIQRKITSDSTQNSHENQEKQYSRINQSKIDIMKTILKIKETIKNKNSQRAMKNNYSKHNNQ